MLAKEQTTGSVQEQREIVSRLTVSEGAKAPDGEKFRQTALEQLDIHMQKRKKPLTFAMVEPVYYTSGGGNVEREATAGHCGE